MTWRLESTQPDFVRAFERFLSARWEAQRDVEAEAAVILAQVRDGGDAALIELTHRFDRVRLTRATLRVSRAEVEAAWESVADDVRAALALAADRIRSFHLRFLPKTIDVTDEAGVRLGARYTPVESVGLYVPGGRAAYPSSLLMNAIPARVAGVGRVCITVPAPDGVLNPLVLAAARLCGIDEIYRVGGAQAIGALAFGTESVRPVAKITGPGNAWVAAAKRQVFGRVGIDLIAGPSEILVVADAANDPDWVAADLLSQAEHDPAAQAVLITDDAGLASCVVERVEAQLGTLPTEPAARASWERHGAVILVRDLASEAPALIDRIAPEHLMLAVAAPEELFALVKHAGAVFLGRHTPEAIGDYVAGTNHVLPTDRSARFSGGLGVSDFLKRTSFVACSEAALHRIGPAAVTLARAEGLEAHARSVTLRLGAGDAAPL